VENGGDADARTEMTGIGGDGEQGLSRHPEQQVVNLRLVVKGDVGDLGRQGEDNVEVSNRQQVCFALGQPGACGGALALGLPTIGQGKSMAGR
jgi:hypothetical protein